MKKILGRMLLRIYKKYLKGAVIISVAALALSARAAHPAEKLFNSWDEFYIQYIRSKAQSVATDMPPYWRHGEQVSRDFEIGDQILRISNWPTSRVQLNGRPIHRVMDWPKSTSSTLDLHGAQAFTYPATPLFACVQANFAGLGQSGTFQRVKQLFLIFHEQGNRSRHRLIRITGYGIDCRGIYQSENAWHLVQAVTGNNEEEIKLKWWRIGQKDIKLLERSDSIQMQLLP